MNILISGGFGYLGNYLAEYLVQQGHDVGILVRSIPSWFNKKNSKLEVYQTDITTPIDITLNKNYDMFLHLAAANEIGCANPRTAIEANVLGTKHVLDFCKNQNISRFIYFSTIHVYGADDGVIDESAPQLSKNDYALTHYFAELYAEQYAQFGITAKSLRVSNVYGAHTNTNINRWSIVPNCFCQQAIEDKSITLYTSGQQTRDFLSLYDMARITERLCQQFDTIDYSTMNMVRGESLSIIDVAKAIQAAYAECFDSTLPIHIQSDEPKHPPLVTYNNQRILDLGHSYTSEHTMAQEVKQILLQLKERGTEHGSN